MHEANSNVYHNEAELRRRVEKASKRSLTDAEWANVAPGWTGPYADSDVAELVTSVREGVPQQPKPPREEEARGHRRAHVERTALAVRAMVEEFRDELFEHKDPPFRNRGIDAAEWIEEQAQVPELKRFSIEVNMPAHLGHLGHLESLAWLRDYLTQSLVRFHSRHSDDEPHSLKTFLDECGAIRKIGGEVPILAYLGVNPSGEINIKRVPAPDGTLLGRLQSKAEELAKAVGWEPYAAVHHLLTGGIMSPAAVQATSWYRAGPGVFGDTHTMTLKVSDPGPVTEQDLTNAFKKARAETAPPWNQRPRRRGRVATRSEQVAAFVEERPRMPWRNRVADWNQRHPDQAFRTTSAMKQAYRRATLR